MSEADTAVRYDALAYFDAGSVVSAGQFLRIDDQTWNVGAIWSGPAVVKAELKRVERG